MGYDLHITRRDNWFEQETDAIDIEEWLELVRSDPEMRLDGYAEATVGHGAVFRVDDPTMAVWVGYSKHGQNDSMSWLWYVRGNIVAKNPDGEIRRKMWLIASTLSAKVQGDDGEFYGSNGEPVATEAVADKTRATSRPWWHLW